jgi:hypothetical protein
MKSGRAERSRVMSNGNTTTIPGDQLRPWRKRETNRYLREAIEAIDGEFGEGYARANPGLVGALVQASVMEDAGQYFGDNLWEISDSITNKSAPDFSALTEAVQNIARMLDLYSCGGSGLNEIARVLRERWGIEAELG